MVLGFSAINSTMPVVNVSDGAGLRPGTTDEILAEGLAYTAMGYVYA